MKAHEQLFQHPLYLKTLEFIKHKHDGQRYKGNEPYHTHCEEVARISLQYCNGSINFPLTALCHDLYEQTDTTEKELMILGLPKSVIVNVCRLTQEDGQDEDKHINYIYSSDSKVAIGVKLSDIQHDMQYLSTYGSTIEDKQKISKNKIYINRLNKKWKMLDKKVRVW